MTFISTQSFSAPLRQSVLQSQAALAQAQKEISSGTYADLGLALGAKTGTSLSFKVEIDRLGSFSSSNSAATTRLSATANALTTLITSTQSVSADLIRASSAGGTTTALQSTAKSALQSFIAQLNTTSGSQNVFGGIKTDTTPIADYFGTPASTAKQNVDAAFQQTFNTTQDSTAAGSISGSDMTNFLDNQFDALFSDSNWQSSWSSASSQTMQSTIAPSQTLTTSVSANETAFRQMAEAYTMLNEFTGQNLSDSARAAVVTKATSLLSAAQGGLSNIQSDVGVAQASVASVDTSISAQVTVLKSSVSDLESVDPYALSSQVTTLQNQLEASYELTSRLKQLSLTNYLTG